MATKQPENVLVDRIRRAVHQAHPHAWILKAAGGPFQSSGVPDLLVVVDGLMVGIEVKRQQPGETIEHARARTTTLQEFQIDRLREAGAVAGVAVTPQEALALVDEAIERADPKRRKRKVK